MGAKNNVITFKFPALRAEGEATDANGRLEIEVRETFEAWSITMTIHEAQLVVYIIAEPGKYMESIKVATRLEPLFSAHDWKVELRDIIKQWGTR